MSYSYIDNANSSVISTCMALLFCLSDKRELRRLREFFSPKNYGSCSTMHLPGRTSSFSQHQKMIIYNYKKTVVNVHVLEPIFHQNANSFTFGSRVGHGPQCEHFALPIPTCWYPKGLTDPMRTQTDPTRTPTEPMQTSMDPTQT